MCVCVLIHKHANAHICIHVCKYMHIYANIYIYIYICIYLCMYVYIYTYIYIHIHTCMHAYMYRHVCIRICMCNMYLSVKNDQHYTIRSDRENPSIMPVIARSWNVIKSTKHVFMYIYVCVCVYIHTYNTYIHIQLCLITPWHCHSDLWTLPKNSAKRTYRCEWLWLNAGNACGPAM